MMTACLCTHAAEVFAQQPPTRMLLVYAPAPDSPTADNFIQSFRTAVRQEIAGAIEFYEEYLDLDRFPGEERRPQLVRYFSDKYRGFRLDVIVPVGSVALQFATDHLRRLLPGVPIVFTMTFQHRVDVAALPPNVTGRLISVPLGPTLEMARRLQPDAERVVVIGGSSAIDSVAIAGALASLTPLRDSLRLELWRGKTYAELMAAVRRLPSRTIVFFAHFRRDGAGQLFVPLDVIDAIGRDSRAPVYGYVDKMLGHGILGGAMIRHDDEAGHTGRLVARVLRRPAGDAMPVPERAPVPFVVDWRQLRRWRMDEGRLPPNTAIQFREPTAWERYRGPILGALILLAAQSLLIGLLLAERRKRIRAQRSVEEQAAYEQTIAHLTTDAVRHAPGESPAALEDALARIGRFASARTVTLIENNDSQAPRRLTWSGSGADTGTAVPSGNGDSRLELPLVADGVNLGVLELYRANGATAWSPRLERQLRAASEIIAGALARSQAERRADEIRRQVAHMGRVSIVGELAAGLAHELKQPLGAIRLNSQTALRLLRNTPADLREAEEILEDIENDTGRATQIIENIRALLRKQAPAPVPVDLNETCRRAAQLLERDAASRSTRLDLSLDEGLPRVVGDPVQLQQVVLNLTLNAVDAASGSSGDRSVRLSTAVRDREVEISVRDSGKGLRADVQQRLFEPFFSTKADGLGMGLPIVYSIVQRHRGRVIAENVSQSGGGAIFRVRLPLNQDNYHVPR